MEPSAVGGGDASSAWAKIPGGAAPPAEDFGTIVDRQLQDLRRSLKREHDRVLRLREGLLQEEVTRLRCALAALRASPGASCKEGAEDFAEDGPAAAAAAAFDIRLDGVDGKWDVEETHLPSAHRRMAQVRAEATHKAPAPGAPPGPLPDLHPDQAGGDTAGQEHTSEEPREEPREERRPSQQSEHGESFHTLTEQRQSQRQSLVNDVLRAAQEMDARKRSTGSADEMVPVRDFTNYDRIERYVNPFMCVVVLLNAIMIGIATDIEPEALGWIWMDLGFVIIYMMEVVIKIQLLGIKGFVWGRDWGWNVFDSAIIALAVLDLTLSFMFYGTEVGNNTPSFIFIRLVRMTRFGRIIRVFQFEVFKELLTMLNGLVSALRTLVWAFILLFFPIYTLGLLLTSLVGHSKVASPMAVEAFGRLGPSMFLVFRCVTGDCSLSNGTPVMSLLTDEFGWLYAVSYVAVVMLVTFGIFNLIMATFVDNALETARRNEIVRMRTRLNDKERQTQKTSELVYKLLDLNNSKLPEEERQSLNDLDDTTHTKVTKEVFDEFLMDEDAQEILEDLDVPEDDRSGLFDVLDADGGGTLQIDELISGIIRLRGDPRRSDVVQVSLVVRSIQDQISKIGALMERKLQDVQVSVDGIQKASHFPLATQFV